MGKCFYCRDNLYETDKEIIVQLDDSYLVDYIPVLKCRNCKTEIFKKDIIKRKEE